MEKVTFVRTHNADYLERVIASAEEQGLIPDDSIAFDNIDDAIAFLESLWVAGLLPDLGRKDPEAVEGALGDRRGIVRRVVGNGAELHQFAPAHCQEHLAR